jgi:hypothetical protein
MENKNMIHFKQMLLPYCLPHDLEILTVNGGESTSQYHTLLAVANFTGKRKKIQSDYFLATPYTYNCFSIWNRHISRLSTEFNMALFVGCLIQHLYCTATYIGSLEFPLQLITDC